MQENLISWPLLQDYTNLPSSLYTLTKPSPVDEPSLILWNEQLAKDLQLDQFSQYKEEVLKVLSGNSMPENLQPIAQAYAGHQFGYFNVLGDGRAILLGELEVNKQLYDLQLKGTGPTVYSRRGDGRATLYSMLREYLISQAMHGLNIPTSRSLAVVSSHTPVYRERINKAGVLTRVMSSHIRVGTFELAARLESLEPLKALFDYTAKRHYPAVLALEIPALELLRVVMERQIILVVQWMSVGFIHGVMNTDNTSIVGETFDYGPCAFMNAYHPQTVFSSIDKQGRYAYANQKPIIKWNLMRFAETLLPLIHDKVEIAIDLCQSLFDQFDEQFENEYYSTFLKKIGIKKDKENDRKLLDNLLKWMKDHLADFTNTFRGFTDAHLHIDSIYNNEAFTDWKDKWQARNPDLKLMKEINPSIIPRNHNVEEALIKAAEENDLSLFNEFLSLLQHPYTDLKYDKFQSPPTSEDDYKTYCGT